LRAAHVVNSVGNAVVIAKIEFRQVTVKVFSAYVMVRPNDAAFQDREHAFNAVGVDGVVIFGSMGTVTTFPLSERDGTGNAVRVPVFERAPRKTDLRIASRHF
jgi:uroporphyrinogen-III synthase